MKRRKHTSDFKSQVALEAIRGEETVSQIASRYNVHPSQVQNLKAAALKGFSNVFEQGNRACDSNEEQLSVLERKVGQLTIENDFLKKSWQGYLKKGGLK